MELLQKILDLRDQTHPPTDLVSIILLGFVQEENEQPNAFCAVSWAGSKGQPSEVRILLKSGWQSLLPASILPYFIDLSEDWKQWVLTQPARILSLISELSVGPLRTMQETTMRKSEVAELITEKLGEVEPLRNLCAGA